MADSTTKVYNYESLENSLTSCLDDAIEDDHKNLTFYIREEYKQSDVLQLIAMLENNNYYVNYESNRSIRKLYIGW